MSLYDFFHNGVGYPYNIILTIGIIIIGYPLGKILFGR
jgi:hypothetical protein